MHKQPAAAVLVVDRDPAAGRAIAAFLKDRHFRVEWVNSGEKAFDRLDAQAFDVLITELRIDRTEGMRVMAVARERNPHACVVFVTTEPDIAYATEAMRQGAFDFQTKPLNLEKLEAVIQHGLAYQRALLEQAALRRRLDERYGLGSFVGQSRQMVRVYDEVRQMGATEEPVFIWGEEGTGKELIAQALHGSSTRRDEPFVKLACAGLSDPIAARELFGQSARGSGRRLKGRAELADRGTLYLDGVSELSLTAQRRLLDLLNTGKCSRPGEQPPLRADLRLLASDAQRPALLLRDGRLDPDFGRRIGSAAVHAPALRERPDDIPLLIEHFLQETAARNEQTQRGMQRDAVNLLMRYDWPGNVRELRNVVEGMAVTARGDQMLGLEDIPPQLREAAPATEEELRIAVGTSMAEVERQLIVATMRACGNNKQKCAQTLKIGLRTLYRKLENFRLP